MRLIIIAAFFLGLGTMLHGQVTTGTITGKVVDAIGMTAVPGTKIWIDTDGGLRGTMCDVEGNYRIDGLKPGVYNLFARSTGFDTAMIVAINVRPDALTFVDIQLTSNNVFKAVPIIWHEPLVDKDCPRITIPTDYIAQSPHIRNPLAMLAGYSSEIQMPEGGGGQVIIRGSRPGDAVYYIDGVKMTDMSSVPGVSIGGLEAYTGGIPAKYGDTTGGVIILETKSYFDLYNAWLVGQ
jgi:hypothetical protein